MINMRACPRKCLLNEIGDRKIVCFGAGRSFTSFLKNNENLREKIIGIIDNNTDLHNAAREGFTVYSVDEFIKKDEKNIVIFITSLLYYRDMIRQLDETEFFNGMNCYIDTWNKNKFESHDFCMVKGEQKIPKIIHYCWFGNTKIPDNLQRCIDTWKRYCPDYKIIRWDESNYDVSKNRYMLQAYEKGKYGFVPDYARLDIIREYGGIYLDTDVELIRSLDDLLPYEFYCGFEDDHYVALGLGFGAVSGHPLINEMIDIYQNLDFVKDGMINYTASPYYQSVVLEKQGFLLNGMYQEKNGVGILPYDAFAPGGSLLLPDEITKHTFSIHHYDASWIEGRNEIQKSHRDLRLLYMERILGQAQVI